MGVLARGAGIPAGPPAVFGRAYLPIVRSGMWSDIGSRRDMEDACVAIDDISHVLRGRSLLSPQAFYGVFDGHGGAAAARYLEDALLGNLMNEWELPSEAKPTHISKALINAFLRTDRELEKMWERGKLAGTEPESGTTALAALILGSTLYVANAGDCRAVLSKQGKAIEITKDHRPDSEAERARVMAAGGHIVDEYLNDKLAVTRALGDWHYQDLKSRTPSDTATTTGPLIAEPEVFQSELEEGHEFMVLACDGLWDAFRGQSQEVISCARRYLARHNDPKECSKDLVSEALRRDATDNLTVVTVCFSLDPPTCSRQSGDARMRRSVSVEGLKRLQGVINDN